MNGTRCVAGNGARALGRTHEKWHNSALYPTCEEPSHLRSSCPGVPTHRVPTGWVCPPHRYETGVTTKVAVRIRLKRMGKIHAPVYRVVVVDSRKKRDGRVIEEVGLYDPTPNPSTIRIESDRVQYWLGVGAQPSDQVRNLLVLTGDIAKFNGKKDAVSRVKVAEGDKAAEAAAAIKDAEAAAEKRKADASAKKAEEEAAQKAAEEAAAAEAAAEEAAPAEEATEEA